MISSWVRWARPLIVAACLAACRDLATPEGSVLAVSRIRLPSPGLVVGDTMRDSLGVASPLLVTVFDENGDTITPAPAVTFVLFDTTALLLTDTLVGRSTGTARIVATVAGLQTQIEAVPVTLRPDTIVAADSIVHRRGVNLLTGDTTFASADLSVIVQNRGSATPSGVSAVVVTYELTQVPLGGAGPSVVFVGGTTAARRDTTDSGGRASRAVRLRIASQPTLPDTATVTATASYRGQTLGTVQFTIVFQTQ